ELGRKRFYRVFRVCYVPQAATDGEPSEPFWPSVSGLGSPYYGWGYPMRSRFAHPYLWQGHTPSGYSDPDWTLADPVDLKEPRWIAVVDEFRCRDAMMSRNEYDGAEYGGDSGVKRGQLSRRIVEISPTGYV